MNKMSKYWVATASLLYPDTSPRKLVTRDQIRSKHEELFGEALSPSLEQQLISWKRRYADNQAPTRGGSRNRYLFRTSDGRTPDPSGRFRLYKRSDGIYDGTDKSSGPTCPARDDVEDKFRYLLDWYIVSYGNMPFDLDNESEADSAEAAIQCSDLTLTEKTSLIKSRRGQGVFKNRVACIEARCRLMGTTELQFLIASHIKPWAHSTNAERLDGNNGLLLSPHVDRLFDKGFLTFNRDGSITIAPEAAEVCRQWSISVTQGGQLSMEQEEYMQYHRKYVYRKWMQESSLDDARPIQCLLADLVIG
jgi:hypothetical protein